MRDEAVWFGEVRSALAGAADVEGWERLCALLAAPEAEARAEEWLPYVTAEVERRWPEAARVAPRAWVERVAAGDIPAAWSIVRECAMDGLIGGDAQLVRLVERGVFDALCALDLSDCGVAWQGLCALLAHDTPRLRALAANHTPLGEGFDTFVRGLQAERWSDGPSTAVRDAIWGGLVSLESLKLAGCGLTLRCFEYLYCCVDMSALRHFVADDNPQMGVGEPYWTNFVVGTWTNIVDLSLNGCGYVGDILEMFYSDGPLTKVERLSLSRCRLDVRQLEYLGQEAPKLKVLRLQDAGIGAREARVLASASWASGLEVLELDGNDLGEEGCAALAQSARLSEAIRRQFL